MYLENIIKALDILAWPLTLIFLTWFMRKPIQSLIPLIHKIKFQGLELEFLNTLKQAKDNIQENFQIELNTPIEDPKLYDAIKISPDYCVLEAWKVLEQSARKKVEALLPDGETFKSPLQRPIDYLEFKGALTPLTASAIRDLRTLRNQVAHSSVEFVSKEGAIQYVELATGILGKIDSITDLPKVKLRAFTILISEINSLIDSKKFDDITIKEVYEWIKKEEILPSLGKRTEGKVDLSIYGVEGPYSNFAKFYHEQMKRLADVYAGNHERKWGVNNLGLCLLLAWTNQLVQYGSGWHPDEM